MDVNVTQAEMSPFVRGVKDALRGARGAARMSIDEAAEASGVSASTIWRLESLKASDRSPAVPDTDQLARLAAAYGTTVTAIVKAAEERPTTAVSTSTTPSA